MEVIKEYVSNKKSQLKDFFANEIIKPTLAIVQLNDDEASNAYIRGKLKDCSEIGISTRHIKLPITTTEEELLKLIDNLNNDLSITAFIVQMPLPKHISEDKVKKAVKPSKDVDGFNLLSKYIPATPKGIVEYLSDNNFDFDGKNAVILGRSNIVGKPMHDVLLSKNMNVINLHSHTSDKDKKFFIEHADLIVVAVGKPYFLDNKYKFGKNAVVIDVGINRVDGKLLGDCKPGLKVSFQSPVPGGVGLLTRLALLLNFKEVYQDSNK